MGERVQGGRLAARAIAAAGIDTIFTLSGGHVMPIYEGCRHEGVRVVDVRHEQSAAHAAEAWGRVRRTAGRRARDGGPGRDRYGDRGRELPRGPDAARRARRRAPARAGRMGRAAGVRPALADEARSRSGRPSARRPTASPSTSRSPSGMRSRRRAGRSTSSSRPTSSSRTAMPSPSRSAAPARAVRRPGTGSRPRRACFARPSGPRSSPGAASGGTAACAQLARLAETARLPVFLNGSGRGSLPPDHELFFQHSRSAALEEADVVCVVGTPLDFRLRYGRFAAGTS